MATELTPYQRDILIRTALGEARGEGVEGMADVIQVILNRANSGDFPADPAAAALQPNEFSAWNPTSAGGNNPSQFSTSSDTYKSGERALDLVLSGTRPDYTGGALFYKTPSVKSPFHDSQNKYGTIERNGHLYYPTRPVPPGEIPNVVASLQDTTPPLRVAPTPRTMSDDLGQMRDPRMSASAQMAQVTPLPPPLPQRRPSAPDIVTPSMAAVNAQRGNVNATRAVDMIAATQNAVTPRLTADGSNIYSYHIPDMTPTTVTGGLGSLTPSPARVRLPELPPSNIGQPPTTRVVQSVPFTASSMPNPTSAQINDAARRASLTVTQSNVERALPSVPTAQQATAVTAPQPFNPRARDSNYAANTALGERVATQMAPVFNQPGFIPNRLVPNPIVQPSFVPLNQPPIQVVPSPMSAVPLPRRRPDIAPMRTPQAMPRMAAQSSPLRVTVNGAGSYSAPRPQPMTPIQSLMAQGMSQAQAYNALTQRAPTLEDRITGRTGLSSYSGSASSISG
jgi:hypothetical protein